MLKHRLFIHLLLLSILITACSSPATPAPTETATQSTAQPGATQPANEACTHIQDKVRAYSEARRESGENSSSPDPGAPSTNGTFLTGPILCMLEVKASQLRILPERIVYVAAIQIESAGELGDQENLLEGQEGGEVVVFSDLPLLVEQESGLASIVVTFRGEGEAGAFWVVGERFTWNSNPHPNQV